MKRSALAWVAAAAVLAGAPSRLPNTSIKAHHYGALKDVLIPGDMVYAFAIRDPAPGERPEPGQQAQRSWKSRRLPETVWNERKYAERVAAMDQIHDPHVQKMIIISSIEDLKANLSRFPKDLNWVGYNTEPGMTPAKELLDMENSVREFARIAHGAGWKVQWGPTNFMLFEDEAKYLGLAKYLDGIGLQHQRTLQNEGVEAFAELTKKRAAMVRKINPKCMVGVQVVIGRGANTDLIRAIQKAAPYVDSADIWTMQETATALEILRAVRK